MPSYQNENHHIPSVVLFCHPNIDCKDQEMFDKQQYKSHIYVAENSDMSFILARTNDIDKSSKHFANFYNYTLSGRCCLDHVASHRWILLHAKHTNTKIEKFC
jgi:hypothetical protein